MSNAEDNAIILCVYPHPVPDAILEVLKEAKASLALDFMIKPCAPIPGVSGRILALGAIPPFVNICVPVADPLNVESVKKGLMRALGEGDDEDCYTMADQLSALLGATVTEVFDEREEQRVRFV